MGKGEEAVQLERRADRRRDCEKRLQSGERQHHAEQFGNIVEHTELGNARIEQHSVESAAGGLREERVQNLWKLEKSEPHPSKSQHDGC